MKVRKTLLVLIQKVIPTPHGEPPGPDAHRVHLARFVAGILGHTVGDPVELRLEGKWGDLSRAAREAIAIEGYRSGALSRSQVQGLLGLRSRWEVDALLRRAGVCLECTEEDLDREIQSSHELTGR